jgi:hypothetical protein
MKTARYVPHIYQPCPNLRGQPSNQHGMPSAQQRPQACGELMRDDGSSILLMLIIKPD